MSKSSIISYENSVDSTSHYATSTASDFAIAVAPSGSVNLTMGMRSVNCTGHNNHANRIRGFIKTPRLMRKIRVVGLIAIISYTIAILFSWIYINLDGQVYFLAGEPNLVIKYMEWALGFTGLFVAVDFLLKEINEMVG